MTYRLTSAAFLLCAVFWIGAASTRATADTSTTSGTTLKAAPETALQRIQRSVLTINKQASTPEGEAAVVKRLSSQLGASEDLLRNQHETWGLGYGEIAMAYGFAKSSKKGKTPADVVEMRNSGKDWDAIAKDLGVKVDQVATKMKKSAAPAPSPQPKPAGK